MGARFGNGGNDGDSFLLGHESGSQRFRLYFVDTPEKSRRYPDRLQHQARYFNNISIDTLTAGGKEAEHFTLDLLRRHKFAAWTKWESVMDSDRFHVLIRFTDMPGEPWLHEQLVKAGLARIYTMPVDLPDGAHDGYRMDLPLEAESLMAEIAAHKAQSAPDDDEQDEPALEKPVAVSFSTRAFPLLDMLRAAQKEGRDVMWGV